jgi:pimeloyl-ACP methyl ester carboxylesterase
MISIVREYGTRGRPTILAIHGGPGAAGGMALFARRLGVKWRVLEPFQRGSSDQALTVATHVQDLAEVVETRCDVQPPLLVGHSWGAMLSLAYAAAHPATVSGLALIGCGTFTESTRAEYKARLEARVTPEVRESLTQLGRGEQDPNQRLAAEGRAMERIWGYDVLEGDDDPLIVDAVAHEQTWSDMLRLQQEGFYPGAFSAITCPVLMLHGDVDPHPGQLTRDDLKPHVPHLEYRELSQCGHSPWLERQCRDEFYRVLDEWISAVSGTT